MENIKKSYKNNNLNYQLQHITKSLNYLMDYLSDIQSYFEYIINKYETLTNKPLIMTYKNKKENRIAFKIKIEYHLKLLMPETMKLLGSTKMIKLVKRYSMMYY